LRSHECIQKLQGAKGAEVDEDVHARPGDSTSNAVPSVETVQNVNSSPKKDALRKRILRSQRNIRHVLKLTTEEDDFLKKGITKHGFGQWTAILRDLYFKFQDGRTADSLKKRAGMKMPLALHQRDIYPRKKHLHDINDLTFHFEIDNASRCMLHSRRMLFVFL